MSSARKPPPADDADAPGSPCAAPTPPRRAAWPRALSLLAPALASALLALVLVGFDPQPASAATNISQVEVGQNHACVLDANGAVTCWGDDSAGQVSAWGTWPYRGEKFASVSAGSFLTCGIKRNDSVMCWGHPTLETGSNRETTNEDWGTWTGRTTQTGYTGWVNTPPETVKFKPESLSVGNYHACAIKTDGEMACWGKAGSDRLVIPKDSSSQTITDWTMVEAGFANACGIREGGSVVCWGRTSHNRSAGPSGAGPFIDVTLALYNGCALAADGSVECWGGHSGYNIVHPQDTTDGRTINTQINTPPPGVKFTSIEMSTTDLYGCGIAANHAVHCWGWKLAYPPQLDVPGGLSSRSISVGSFANCVLDAGSYLTCWGIGDHGVTIPPAGAFTQTDGGSNFSCAVKSNQSVACWGNDGNWVIRETPATGTFTKVTADNTHACAIKSDGTVQCWGGVFLSGNQYLRYAHAVAPTGEFTDLDAGLDLTCGVKTDGTLQCWGGNATPDTHDRLTVPTGSFSRVAVGATHACAIKSDDKSIECWGEELFFDREGDGTPDDIGGKGNHTSTTPPSGTHRYTDITAGEGHTCAIREDKKAVCWGYHADGRYAVPGWGRDAQGFGNLNYVDIATGGNPNCAIREGSGALSCWNNEKSQYLPSAEILVMRGFKSLGAGSSHMCAVGSDDALVCWGAGAVIPFPAEYGPPLHNWSAKLTVHDLGDGKEGCDNTHTDATKRCTVALTDDDFTFQGRLVHITGVYTDGQYMHLALDTGAPDAFEDFSVYIDSVINNELHRFAGDAFPLRWRSDLVALWALIAQETVSIRPTVQFRRSGAGVPPRPPSTPPTPPTSDNGGGNGGGGGGLGFPPTAPPEFTEGPRTERTVPENAVPGDPVGGPVTATDPDGGVVTYTIRNEDDTIFAVDPDTGQITVKEGVDIAEGETYTILLIARSPSGALAFIDVTITVTEAERHPYDANRDGAIDLDEVVDAARDYFAGDLTLEEVLEIIRLYFEEE